MTNFDFLKEEKQFKSFADVAISAEQLLHIDTAATVLICRRTMELAIKWMYSMDKELEMPEDTRLSNLMENDMFQNLIEGSLYTRMEYIRKVGNTAAHGEDDISLGQAKLCIENLFYLSAP